MLAQYAAKLSGPVLDRLDLQLDVASLTSDELLAATPGEPSAVVRERVLRARALQLRRGALNALLPSAALAVHAALDSEGRRLVANAIDRSGMSARAVHRCLRVARTIADLQGEERIRGKWLGEALQLRGYEAKARHLD